MSEAAEAVQRSDRATLEERLPDLMDEVLARLSKVGVERILELAGAMVEARLNEPSSAHLVPGPGQDN